MMAAVLAALLPLAGAQDRPAPAAASHAMPRPDELEPAVNTSADFAPGGSAAAPDVPHVRHSRHRRLRARSRARVVKVDRRRAADRTVDHLTLGTTDITGNRELPRVMYIVPWKHADLGQMAIKPMNSLVDEVLQPIDRDVFRRQTRYYDALQPDAPTPVGPAAASASGAGH